MVQELLSRHPGSCLEFIYPEGFQSRVPIPGHVTTFVLSRQLFQRLDLFGTRFPLLVCKAPSLPRFNPSKGPQGIELFCPLGDPANVGALLRSCGAFDVSRVIILKEAAYPLHPKSIRAMSGSVFDQSLCLGPSLEALGDKTTGQNMVVLDTAGESLSTFQWPRNVRLLVGEEGQGIPRLLVKHQVAIPMMESMNSLNATVAASIALYAYRFQYPLRRLENTL